MQTISPSQVSQLEEDVSSTDFLATQVTQSNVAVFQTQPEVTSLGRISRTLALVPSPYVVWKQIDTIETTFHSYSFCWAWKELIPSQCLERRAGG